MRKLILIFFILLSLTTNAQDSLITINNSWYIRSMPISINSSSIYSLTGTSNPYENKLTNRTNSNIEIGYSTGIVDIGLSYGRLNIRQDSSSYLESRITLDVCQIRKFSNEFTLGVGYSFNNSFPVMLEVASTMMLQVSKRLGVGLITGYYDLAGNYGDYSKNFYGIFLRYGLARSENGSLFTTNRFHKHH